MALSPATFLDLATPYFRRSMLSAPSPAALEAETAIDAWLAARDVRLVTREGIEYERKRNRVSLSFLTEMEDSMSQCESGTSSPCKLDQRLSLEGNSLFMRRKESSRCKDVTI